MHHTTPHYDRTAFEKDLDHIRPQYHMCTYSTSENMILFCCCLPAMLPVLAWCLHVFKINYHDKDDAKNV